MFFLGYSRNKKLSTFEMNSSHSLLCVVVLNPIMFFLLTPTIERYFKMFWIIDEQKQIIKTVQLFLFLWVVLFDTEVAVYILA